MSTSDRRDVLGLGLQGPQQNDLGARIFPVEIAKAKANNLNLDIWLADALNKPAEEILPALKLKLEEKKWAAVSIGFGIRGNRDLTPLFEKMVNLVVEVVPGVKFGFSSRPDDVADACGRALS